MTDLAVGIDVGFSETAKTCAWSVFEVTRSDLQAEIDVLAMTMVVSWTELAAAIDSGREPFGAVRARLVTFDAPVTPLDIAEKPATGRLVDRRFSRGDFAQSNRGPAPSSIAVPRQGWPLYRRGMKLVRHLDRAGFPYLQPANRPDCIPRRFAIEVVPKLTMSLLSPADRVRGRPKSGAYRKLDDWLFSQWFAIHPRPGEHAEFPQCGTFGPSSIGQGLRFGPGLRKEGQRIHELPRPERHEAIGAFVAGFQGALVLADHACAVGTHDGHFALPRSWHQDWERAWTATEGQVPGVTRVNLEPHRPR